MYEIRRLGNRVYDAVNAVGHVLSRELGVLSDSVVESHCVRGLPAMTFSNVTGRASADGGVKGILNSSCVALALGRGFVADRCQRRSSMDGLH